MVCLHYFDWLWIVLNQIHRKRRPSRVSQVGTSYFWKYDVFTCDTRPGWRCRRRWAWLEGFTYLRQFSIDISFLKLDIKHVPCVILKIWHTHLWDSAWLPFSTSFSIDFSWKEMDKKHVFDSFDELAVVLPLVGFIDVDWGFPWRQIELKPSVYFACTKSNSEIFYFCFRFRVNRYIEMHSKLMD